MTDEAADFREEHLRNADFLGAFGVLRRGDTILFVANERVIDGERVRVWDLPGGQVEPRERLHEALARELDEEIGVRIPGGERLLFVQEGERTTGGRRKFAWRSFFFAVEAFEGEPHATDDVHGARWIPRAELASVLIAPYHDSFLEWLEHGGTWFVSRWID